MAGYVLILAILILGGMIATLGDRIGTKVGKSRLSVFKLRPRHTATLVTIVTGGLISASTLGILLATSSQLRDGLFRLESIRKDLQNTQQEKRKVEEELVVSQSQRAEAKQQLDQINRSLSEALVRQSQTQAQLQNVQGKFQQATSELQKVLAQEETLRGQVKTLITEQENLVKEGEKLLKERNQLAQEGEKLIKERNQLAQNRDQLEKDLRKISSDREDLRQKVAESESRLVSLEKQRTQLAKEIDDLETSRQQLASSIQALRRGNVAIQSEQVLAAAVIRGELTPDESRRATYRILQEAEQYARYLLDFLPGKEPPEPVVKITEAQIDLLLDRIKDGRSYVIRILSTGNYLRQETNVAIAADVTENKQIFAKGEVIAALPFTPNLDPREMESRVGQLFSLVSFRAQREGVLVDPVTGKVGSFSPTALSELLESIPLYKASFEIQAVAKEKIFTSSNLSLELVIVQDGVEIRRFS